MSIVSKLDATRRAIVPVIQHGAGGVNERDKALLSGCFAIDDVNIFSLPRFESGSNRRSFCVSADRHLNVCRVRAPWESVALSS